jgi:hypothetical protein
MSGENCESELHQLVSSRNVVITTISRKKNVRTSTVVRKHEKKNSNRKNRYKNKSICQISSARTQDHKIQMSWILIVRSKKL